MNAAVRRIAPVLALVASLAMAAPAFAQDPADAPLSDGVWRNAKDSIHVELRPCGGEVCGYVIWASPKVQEQAQRAGSPKLIGLQLLRDFARTTGRVYKGKAFVPDLNATFTGTAERIDARTLKARGCLLAGILCKSQVWTRIDLPAPALALASPGANPPAAPR